MRITIFVSAMLLASFGSCRASAAFTEYPGDPAGWFAAIGDGNYATIDFDEFPNNTTITNQYEPYGVTFSGLNFITMSESDSDGWALRMFDGNDIYFDQPINSFAADIRGLLQIELYSGDTLIHTTQIFGVPLDEVFGGVVSDQPFDHIRVYDPDDNLAITQNIYFGPPIPAPGAIVPLSFALLLPRRRRRCSEICPGDIAYLCGTVSDFCAMSAGPLSISGTVKRAPRPANTLFVFNYQKPCTAETAAPLTLPPSTISVSLRFHFV